MDLHTLNQLLNDLAVGITHVSAMIPWDLVAASGILSPLTLAIKQPLKKRIEEDKTMEKVMMTVILVLSTAAAAASYLLTVTTSDPSIIAVRGLMIAAMSQPWYYLCFKPAYRWFSGELAKARAFDAEVKSAAIPASGLPTQNP